MEAVLAAHAAAFAASDFEALADMVAEDHTLIRYRGTFVARRRLEEIATASY